MVKNRPQVERGSPSWIYFLHEGLAGDNSPPTSPTWRKAGLKIEEKTQAITVF
jgi:hypothetical protein